MFDFGIVANEPLQRVQQIELICKCKIGVDTESGEIAGFVSCNKQHNTILDVHRFGWADYDHLH